MNDYYSTSEEEIAIVWKAWGVVIFSITLIVSISWMI